MYNTFKRLLFKLPPEAAHDISLKLINSAGYIYLNSFLEHNNLGLPIKVMGLDFPNPVGLAAGFDKDGIAINGLSKMGFGFIELGTVTPRPQLGNPKPRLFRSIEELAVINRMGFNNLGVDNLIENVREVKYPGIIGINIGKNFDTPLEEAFNDYAKCLEKVYPYAGYIALNISSPNTPGLRKLQFGDSLKSLLEDLKERHVKLNDIYGKYVPMAVKIDPDMLDSDIKAVSNIILNSNMDAIIATNTTVKRASIRKGGKFSKEVGGLSGAPLLDRSTYVTSLISSELGEKMPIIAVGGITEGKHAAEKIKAGASLVQIYSGLIYKGPPLIRESIHSIAGLST